MKGVLIATAELGSVAAFFIRRDQLSNRVVPTGQVPPRNWFALAIPFVVFYGMVDAFVDAHLDAVDWGELSVKKSPRGDPMLSFELSF